MKFFMMALVCALTQGVMLHSDSTSSDTAADLESLISDNKLLVFSMSDTSGC